MATNVQLNLPLELHLKALSESRAAEFPNRSGEYFSLYSVIKRRLASKYYDVAGSGLAQGGDRFTRHDIGHVDDVIKTAGDLLGYGSEAKSPALESLHPYEVFVLLLAILLHDAGNAVGREGHEKRAGAILEDLGSLVDMDSFEKRLVASIANAHGGRTLSGSKDTIAEIRPPIAHIGSIAVRARLLAALVRLADELSENPRRADEIVLEQGNPPHSVVHNLFCQVVNIHVDYRAHQISLDFDVDRRLLDRKYPLIEGGGEEQVLLIDYIRKRIEKCEMERRYCQRFLANFAGYERVRVRLCIRDGDTLLEEIALDFEEAGYPAEEPSVISLQPRFDGQVILATHGVVSSVETA